MRPIPKYLALCIILSFLCTQNAMGQCEFEVEYVIEKQSERAYSVFLHSETTLTSIKIQLYDLLQGKILEEKQIDALTNVRKEVFKNIPPSRYSIIIRMDECDKPKTLGGINGISIGIQG